MRYVLYRNDREKKWFWFSVGVAGIFALLTIASPRARIMVNWTESIHHHIFLAVYQTPNHLNKGDFVYLHFPGHKFFPSEDVFLKVVAGVPGDQVEVREREIYVNGTAVAFAKEKSRKGDPLEPLQFRGTIPEGKLLLLGEHKDSYDSRYQDFGLVDLDRVIGTGYAIF